MTPYALWKPSPWTTLDLAEATGLTAYDASYLWLSRALGAELFTLDGVFGTGLSLKLAGAIATAT